jgi:calnexin
MQNNIMFDNIYIGHSVEDAEKLAEEAWKPKHDAEVRVMEAEKPKTDDRAESFLDSKFMEDPVNFVKQRVDAFVAIAKNDPLQAIQYVPEVAGGIVAVLIGFIALIATLAGGSSSATPAPKKKDDKASKVEATKGAATGADTGKSEATKRNTRSQQS